MANLRLLVVTTLSCLCLVAPLTSSALAKDSDAKLKVVEAERAMTGRAQRYRDTHASGGKVAVLRLGERSAPLISNALELPAGDYLVTAWLDAVPVDLIHSLHVGFRAGSSHRTISAIHFDASRKYQPFPLHVVHTGGAMRLSISAGGESGFNGMRLAKTSGVDETGATKVGDEHLLIEDEEDALPFRLEEDPSIDALTPHDLRVVCDRITIEPLRVVDALVADVEVEKIHYTPGESVNAKSRIRSKGGAGTYTFVADIVTEIDNVRRVYEADVELMENQAREVAFTFALDDTEFGHELRCSLLRDGKVVHDNREYFGVSKNVYRIGITGYAGSHHRGTFSLETITGIQEGNRRRYANYIELFAWGPCDYSELTPETEHFWSGQTQYHGTITNYKHLIAEGHRLGVKSISYGKASAASLSGYETFQRYPHLFGHGPSRGPVTEATNTFYLERMLYDEFGGWQHWASLWTNKAMPETVELGADELIASARMFGWDGVRWDGHFENMMELCNTRINAELPDYVHGYNIAFANPGSSLFLPSEPVEDFHQVAKNHGLMMDESVRNWSNTQFSPGTMRPFYTALAREANYIKRIGGLPLYIIFDMGTTLDRFFNIVCGLASGQRYTYITSPGDFAFGTTPKFLTRYSAFVWDDTACLGDIDNTITVSVDGDAPQNGPWYRHTTWLRTLPNGKQQVLVNLVNPPVYPAFCNRSQTPPQMLDNVKVSLNLPDGVKLSRALHVSPDLTEGHLPLNTTVENGTATITLPRLRVWSIVVFEVEGDGAPLNGPAFTLTTPVEDAAAYFADQEAKKLAAQKSREAKASAQIAPDQPKPEPKRPFYADYDNTYNIDEGHSKKMARPDDMNIKRDGVLDVHHTHGPFSWLNPVNKSLALIGGGRFTESYMDRVSFRLRSEGCMDGFVSNWTSLLRQDVIVLDNMHSVDLGRSNRVRIADYVENGGSVLVFGGYFNLSLGGAHNTALADMLPIRISKYRNLVNDDNGMALKPVDGFAPDVDWAAAGEAYSVDTSPLKDGSRVLATAGGHPAIVARPHGKGYVMAVLINPHGNYQDAHPDGDAQPYWLTPQWPYIVAACLNELARDAHTVYTPPKRTPKLNPKHVAPVDLMFESLELDGASFTKKLASAQYNMIDAETARTVLEVAVDQADKIEDFELLEKVAERATPFIDESFTPLAERLLEAQQPFLRLVAYKVLGLTADSKNRAKLENGLTEDDQDIVREVLVALGRIGDPGSIEAIRFYMRRGGEKTLAHAALKRCGDPKAMLQGLPIFAARSHEAIMLKCERISKFEDLHGGTSFKLTRAQRRQMEHEYRMLQEAEANAKFDVREWKIAMQSLTDTERHAFLDAVVATENRHLASLAYDVYGRLTGEQQAEARKRFTDAKHPDVRLLGE